MSQREWISHWRSARLPVETMRAHFVDHRYDLHAHESCSFGRTDVGSQTFRCRGAQRTSATDMVMAFNAEDPHDGHSAQEGGFGYRIVHIGPELVTDLLPDTAQRPVGAPHFAEDLGSARLAEVAERSRFALTRAFRELHGLTPGQYQRQLRLRSARRRLAAGSTPADAAICSGFADQAHLTRRFRRCCGITPARFAQAVGS